MAEVGLRINEICTLDLEDIKWDLGRFGKLHVRQGKGTRGSGPRERMVPLINNAGRTLRWFIEEAPRATRRRRSHTAPGPRQVSPPSARRMICPGDPPGVDWSPASG